MHLAHKQFKVWDPRDPRRRSLGGGLGPVSAGGNGSRQKPANVTWNPGFNVFYDGISTPTTDFDFNAIQPAVTGTTYYVDPVTGLDTNTGLSPAQALASIARGINRVGTQSASLTHQILLNLAGDTVFRATNSWQAPLTRSCVIKPTGGRVLNVAAPVATAPVWTKTAGLTNVYETAVATAIIRVYDLSRKFTWAYSSAGRPYYLRYTKVADAATVDTTPDSFFYDSVGGKVYCNTSTRVPDGMVQPIISGSNATFIPNTLGRILWATGIDFIGGGNAFAISELVGAGGTGGDATLRAYLKDCSYQGPSRSNDAFVHTGLGWTYHMNCGAYDSGVDGFSVYGLNAASNTDPAGRRACIDCATYDNGEVGQTQANGETLHSMAQAVSVNCNIGPAYNRPLHDTYVSKHWFVGGSIGPSTIPQPNTSSRTVQAGNAPGQSAEIYLDGTVINPGSQYDLNTTAGSGLFFKGAVPGGLTIDPASAGTITTY